jgi:hypothetical protein
MVNVGNGGFMSKINSEVLSINGASEVVQRDLSRGDGVKLNLEDLFEVVQRFDPVEGMVRRT